MLDSPDNIIHLGFEMTKNRRSKQPEVAREVGSLAESPAQSSLLKVAWELSSSKDCRS
jgi:hypothetical protein